MCAPFDCLSRTVTSTTGLKILIILRKQNVGRGRTSEYVNKQAGRNQKSDDLLKGSCEFDD